MGEICDRDCFNCKFPDCIVDDASENEITDIEERNLHTYLFHEIEKISNKQGEKAKYKRYYLKHIEARREYGRKYSAEYRRTGRAKRYPEVEKKAQKKYNASDKGKKRSEKYYYTHRDELIQKYRERRERIKNEQLKKAKERQRKHEWYEKNKDRITQKHQEWRKENKDKISQKQQEWREKNKEKIKQKNSEWYKKIKRR